MGKAAVALVLCFAVKMLFAQAPPAGGAAIPEGVDARGYKVWMPAATLWKDLKGKKQAREMFTDNVKKTLSGEQPFADGRTTMENYYSFYFFPVLTQTGDNDLKNLATERQNFLRDHLEFSGKQTEPHNLLTSLSLMRMAQLVRDDKFHPAVRYNAMMIIGSLNDQEPIRSGATTVPVPMLRALPILAEEFRRPETIDAIKVPALLGLARHLEFENDKPAGAQPMPAQIRQDIIKDLIAVAQAKDPPLGRDVEGHRWFRRRAVEALGFASLRKPDNDIADALEALLKDETQPVSLRCTVAATLGKIAFAPGKVDPQAVAKELGYLALVSVDSELNRLTELRKEEEDHAVRLMGQIPDPNAAISGMAGLSGMPGGGPQLSGGGYGGGYGGAGGMMTPGGIRGAAPGTAGTGSTDSAYGGTAGLDPSMMDPKAYRFEPARRRIRQELYCIQLGLLGGEDHKPAKTGAPTPVTPTTPAAGATSAPKAEPRGMWVLANATDKPVVDDVYFAVRKLAEAVESKAVFDVYQLDKDLRKEMKNVETAIGRKLAPPVAKAVVVNEDVPAEAGKAAGKKGKAPAGKGAPKAMPKMPAKAIAPPRPMPPVKAATASGR